MIDKDLNVLKPLLRRGLKIYHCSNTLRKILPLDVEHSRESLKEVLRDKLTLSNIEANALVEYLCLENGTTKALRHVVKKLADFCQFDLAMRREDNIINEMQYPSEQMDDFCQRLEKCIHCNHILPSDIRT